MKVFISYSVKDTDLVAKIAASLKPNVQEVLWWPENKELGEQAWQTIHGWIDSSNVVIAVITGNVVTRAMAVGNEIGRAVAKGKVVIPLVGPEVKAEDLGCLHGVAYERLDLTNPEPAIENVRRRLQQLQQRQLAKKEQDDLAAGAAIVGVVVLVICLSKS